MSTIFISYARENAEEAYKIASHLRRFTRFREPIVAVPESLPALLSGDDIQLITEAYILRGDRRITKRISLHSAVGIGYLR